MLASASLLLYIAITYGLHEQATSWYNPLPSYPTVFSEHESKQFQVIPVHLEKKLFCNNDQSGHQCWCSSIRPPQPLWLSRQISTAHL